ncbi:MAG: hypothetical protein GYA59_03345 [Chloroflexi bacterium]|jgi:hypothetical protein|nr:hypothetical protein [Chloroflexota bacterium]
MNTPKGAPNLFVIIFKAVALAMGVASLVLGAMKSATLETQVLMLSIGLLALALASFQSEG